MANILITGGTGLIGRHLSKLLQEKGYNVAILSRQINRSSILPIYYWDWKNNYIDIEAIKFADHIIHLAGTNISNMRWTKKRKKLILDSRVKSIDLIFNEIKKNNLTVKSFISASAIGYYGTINSDKIFTEIDKPASDFLGGVCNNWELAADKFNELNIRTVKLRTGLVLDKKGGLFKRLKKVVKFGFGTVLGIGNQYMPWIHIDDLCNIYMKAVENQRMHGVYNAVTEDHKTNKEFIEILADSLNKKVWLPPIPSVLLKIIFGNRSQLLLAGSRVAPKKLMNINFNYKYPDLKSAMSDLVV